MHSYQVCHSAINVQLDSPPAASHPSSAQTRQQVISRLLAPSLRLEVVSNQECDIERLLVIESGVTVRSVVERQVLVFQLHRSSDALGLPSVTFRSRQDTHHRVAVLVDFACQLEVYSTQDRLLLAVDLERAGDLLDDVGKVTGLERWVCLG